MTVDGEPQGDEVFESAVTIGTYDGVHLGHRRLIDRTIAAARARHAKSVVITFSRHPSAVLRPAAPVLLLTSLAQKLHLLRATGIDQIVVIDFDAARATETAEDFVRNEFVDRLHAREVVVGADFRFGFKRRGDVKLLDALGERYGFVAQGVKLVLDDATHTVVSSTHIREFIGAGSMLEAARLLGRPHEIVGDIVEREQRFQMVVAPSMMLPLPGTYQVNLERRDLPELDYHPNAPIATLVTVGARGEEGVPIFVAPETVAALGDRRTSLSLVFCADRETDHPNSR